MSETTTSSTGSADYAALLSTLDTCCPQTEYEVLRLMRRCVASYDFAHFMIARLPGGDRQSFAERLVMSSWPAELVQRYEAADLFPVSRLVSEVRRTKLPLFEETQALLGRVGEAFEPALCLTMGEPGKPRPPSRTYAALLHTTYGEPFMVALTGTRNAPRGLEAAGLYFLLVSLFERLESTMEGASPVRERLSAREVECLRWAAAGKSSDEIAIILDISAYTVSSYFKSAARKLDAVNRMQAIARAMRLKLI
ncbi:helix-turn-helix transcriptional regulator [Rhizobium sp. CC-YZS058]|uniref:helix-turn-helix transcriptional regulator n=1 Tax=Rhizobium sp. CC-YZS058 TaxID=3042153 RepID=UPI002B05F03E|nr:LuxR C-terminal-related transcriptional regulator [Rhizobium sp. CC-YZS058]MEA3533742.1 LuxR C-terminal-related transcriptional regulator [Rhizobium sp. CC-YZS058]